MADEGAETAKVAPPQKFEFFVYIVESPSAPDLYHGRSEGGLVAKTISLDRIPCVVRTAINREAFGAALIIGFPEVMKRYPGRCPILHLSAHGGGRRCPVVEWRDRQRFHERCIEGGACGASTGR